jgi:predicted enzyme related to lactoylglutathione lyase
MPPIDRLSEVILYVEDMDRMVEFYTTAFDLEIAHGSPEDGFVAFDTGRCRLCLHAGREGDLGDDAPKVVFEVADLSAARETLANHDVTLGDVRPGGPDSRVCDGLDPEGNRFALETHD